jgi:hypothetical protein
MAQCFLCRKKIGLLERSAKLGSQKLVYCFDCAKKEERKQAIELLYDGGASSELLRIPGAVLNNPYSKDVQAPIQLMGDIVFTEKGVVFVKIAEFKAPSQNIGLWFGLVGMLIANSRMKKARKKAWEGAVNSGKLAQSANLDQFIRNSDRVIMFPRNTIKKIYYSWTGGMVIKTTEKSQAFPLEDKKKYFKMFENKIIEYTAQSNIIA